MPTTEGVRLLCRLLRTEPLTLPNDYPLSILDHRISTLRDKLRAMSQELVTQTGVARDELAARIAAETKELDELVFERDILAADAR
jgi:hypothetical protein